MATASDILPDTPGQNFLRPEARADLEAEIAACEAQISSKSLIEQVDKRNAARRLRLLRRDLETQAVPDLSGPELDALRKESRELEERFLPAMPDRDTMMRNPAGAVGRNIAFEKKHKKDILRWKKVQCVLHRDSDDPDVANVERIRPHGSSGVSFIDSQIPPKAISVPSPQYMANYDEIEWKAKKIEEGLARVEALESKLEQALASARAGRPIRQRKQMSEEAKQAARERLAKARQKKVANHAVAQDAALEASQS